MTRRNGDRNPLARRAVTDDGERHDVVIVCSGIAGVLAAVPLVRAGLRVLLLERGDLAPQDLRTAEPDGTIELTPYHASDQSYLIRDHSQPGELQTCRGTRRRHARGFNSPADHRHGGIVRDHRTVARCARSTRRHHCRAEPWFPSAPHRREPGRVVPELTRP